MNSIGRRCVAAFLAAAMAAPLAGCSSNPSVEEAVTEIQIEEELTETIEDNEQVLSRNSQITEVAFESGAPTDDVTLPEGADLWLRSQDGTVDCAVYLAGESDEVYLDSGNASDMHDPNTVIHGNSETLSGITALSDAAYFETSPYLYIFTEGEIREYHVYAVYEAETENILVTYNCYNNSEFVEYIENVLSMDDSSANLNPDLQENILSIRRILTLQVSIDDTTDLIVQAVPSGLLER